MNEKSGGYHIVDLPAGRREMPNLLDLYWWKHSVYGLLEVDVTLVTQYIDEHERQTGEKLSFTGYLAFCVSRALDENKSVQAYLKGRKQLVVFDDVDVALPIERIMGEARAPMVHVIRQADQKTWYEIHKEIRTVQATPVPKNKGFDRRVLFFMRLPWPFPRLFGVLINAISHRDPTITERLAGTVGITAVGMFGRGEGGWGIVPMVQPVGLIVGSTARKPAVVEDRIEPREILSLTVAFDHDVIDGAPAARFVKRLIVLIESGYGLTEEQLIPVTDIGSPAMQKVQVSA